jgi:chemotaxis protein methyltransferase CheR
MIKHATFVFLQKYIHVETGIVIQADQQYLIEDRLTPLLGTPAMTERNIHTLEELCERLAAHTSASLTDLVLDAVTTNETFFFRDAVMFDALRTVVLPDMIENTRGKRKLRIWSAAASTGQEAYSVAMLMRELGQTQKDVEIVGTDISIHILERARRALYFPFEVRRGLPETYLQGYFHASDGEWLLDEAVRSMVRFEQIDLRRNIARLGTFDLILCRNVLIYFDPETKKRVLDEVEHMLTENGKLALGCAEAIINSVHNLHVSVAGHSTFYVRR